MPKLEVKEKNPLSPQQIEAMGKVIKRTGPLFQLAYTGITGGRDEDDLLTNMANGIGDLREVIDSANLNRDQVRRELGKAIKKQANNPDIDEATKGAVANKICELIYGKEEEETHPEPERRIRISVDIDIFTKTLLNSHTGV